MFSRAVLSARAAVVSLVQLKPALELEAARNEPSDQHRELTRPPQPPAPRYRWLEGLRYRQARYVAF